VDIEQDDVRRLLLDQRPGLGEVGSLEHSVAFELEVDPAEQAQRALVVNDEHGLEVRAPPFAAHIPMILARFRPRAVPDRVQPSFTY
jgi:hypothetical protein